MQRLKTWLASTARELIEPGRAESLARWKKAMVDEVSRQRTGFQLSTTAVALQIPEDDLTVVCEGAYGLFLDRAWVDGDISPGEKQALELAAKLLNLSTSRKHQLNLERVGPVFRRALIDTVADGVLSSEEVAFLHRLATAVDMPLKTLILYHFNSEAATAFQTLFARSNPHGETFEDRWRNLVGMVQQLGLTEEQFKVAVTMNLSRYAESMLAAAKLDDEISAEEDRDITTVLALLSHAPQVASYVRGEVERVKLLSDVSAGRLPVVKVTETGLKAGERCHLAAACTYSRLRMRRGEPTAEQHQGRFILTDARAMFLSPTLTLEVNHRRVANVRAIRGGLELESSAKGTGAYYFRDAELSVRCYQVAVSRANQTIVDRASAASTRHIPRDVRQRVWQRDGGRCVDCSSEQYLEFDHVIPHARGGANTDGNVQLLCRGRNAKKSDEI